MTYHHQNSYQRCGQDSQAIDQTPLNEPYFCHHMFNNGVLLTKPFIIHAWDPNSFQQDHGSSLGQLIWGQQPLTGGHNQLGLSGKGHDSSSEEGRIRSEKRHVYLGQACHQQGCAHGGQMSLV